MEGMMSSLSQHDGLYPTCTDRIGVKDSCRDSVLTKRLSRGEVAPSPFSSLQPQAHESIAACSTSPYPSSSTAQTSSRAFCIIYSLTKT